MRDQTAKRLSTIHTGLYKITRGRIGRRLVNNDMLLLSTTGRSSGKTHTVPLLYLRDGEDIVVIASWGGRDDNPEWYKNLKATPEATVQLRKQLLPVTAKTADRHERQRLWVRAVEAYDGYRAYQDRTSREIPIVILSNGRNDSV